MTDILLAAILLHLMMPNMLRRYLQLRTGEALRCLAT